MNRTRRQFLRIAGGGIVVAAGAASVGFLTTRTPHKALAPWQQAGKYDDIRMRSLSYAILAPNPHNRQPWLVDLDTPGAVTLYVDTDRLLKETDPFDRQITIGLGCFLELMVQAAANEGYAIDLDLFPEGMDGIALDKRPVARAVFHETAGISPDPLFAYVLDRRSFKDPFDTHVPVRSDTLTILRSAISSRVGVGTTNEDAELNALRALTWNAFEREYVTPAKLKESIDLMRLGKTEIEAHPDGIDIGGPLMESLILLGMMSREGLADPDSSVFKQGLDMFRDVYSSSQAFIWLTTPGNDRVDQIESGRAWVRINLAATGMGLGLHPISQALQEYPEMRAYYDTLHMRLAASGDRIQMLGRLGYAGSTSPSPRWPLESRRRHG